MEEVGGGVVADWADPSEAEEWFEDDDEVYALRISIWAYWECRIRGRDSRPYWVMRKVSKNIS